MSKFRTAVSLGISAVMSLALALIIRHTTENPALRFASDVMAPIICVVLILTGVFFLTLRDEDSKSGAR